jgi:hypothetical protein
MVRDSMGRVWDDLSSLVEREKGGYVGTAQVTI